MWRNNNNTRIIMNKIIHSKIAFLCFKYLILFKSVVAAGSSKPCLLIEQSFL